MSSILVLIGVMLVLSMMMPLGARFDGLTAKLNNRMACFEVSSVGGSKKA